MSDSLQPPELYPARLLCPWNSPGKNTALGSHSLLQGIFPTQGLTRSPVLFTSPGDLPDPGIGRGLLRYSLLQGIFPTQGSAAVSCVIHFSRASSRPRDRPRSPALQAILDRLLLSSFSCSDVSDSLQPCELQHCEFE